jgi:Cytosol aminopeptidase family, N-terminal domain
VELNVLAQDIRKCEADAVIVGCYEDVRPLRAGAGALDWLLCGALSQLIIEAHVRGAAGEVVLVASAGKIPAPKIFLVGLGKRSGASPEALREAARTAAERAIGAGVARAAMDCGTLCDDRLEESLRAVRQGLAEGAAGRPFTVTLVAPDADAEARVAEALRA